MKHVADLLRARRPDLEIRSLEPLGEGDFHRAYLLNARWVVRVPKHEQAARALASEACLLPRLAPLLTITVPVPALVTGEAGETLALHEYVRGAALTRELWHGMPEPERIRVAARLGAFLRELHGLDTDLARRCGLAPVDHGADMDRLQLRLADRPASLLPDFVRRGLERCFADSMAGAAAGYAPALLHADVSPEHVRVDTDRLEITGVIDWGDARIGDPARDFIFLYEDWGGDFLEHALEAYDAGARDDLRSRVLRHYLADQLEWTLTAAEQDRHRDVEHGVALLAAGLADLYGPPGA